MSDQQQGSGAPEALTEEKIAQIAAQVVNQAFTARSKTLKNELTSEFTKGFESMAKRLDELASTKADTRKKKSPDGTDEAPEAQSPEYRGLQRQMAEMKAQLEDRDRQVAEAGAKAKHSELRSRVAEELSKVGVTNPTLVKAATSILVTEDKRVQFDEDGQLVFIESPDSVLDIATGIRAWSKSEDAKNFIQPTGAMGSGSRPMQRAPQGRPANAPKSQAEEDFELGAALAREFGGASVPIG